MFNVRLYCRLSFWYRIAMKDTGLNLFWAVIWTVVLLAGAASIFWVPAIGIVLAIALIMAVVFAVDFVQAKRRK